MYIDKQKYFNYHKKLVYIIFFISLFWISVNRSEAQLTNILPKSEFCVVHTNNYYKKTIAQDTMKQMVAINKYIPNIKINFVYATASNFTHQILYKKPKAYLRLATVKALLAVANLLKAKGLGLLIYDAYRPYRITKIMWQIIPDERYAANPAKGSGHNRGIAVDLTLYDLHTDKALEMPTPFDDFTEKAHHNYMELDSIILKNRTLLKSVMEQNGFIALNTEWWHYYLPNGTKYELLDFDFKQMKKLIK